MDLRILVRPPVFARLVSGATILLFLALAARQSQKPLHLDAMDFPAVAEATAATGKPIYYRGEGNREHSGLYHPPLYIYSLAGWFKLLGAGPASARMFGAGCVLVFGWTTLLLAGTLLTKVELERLRPWFWALFLLNPYALQSSAVPDIDTTIYGPLLTLLLWSVLRISWRDGIRQPAALSAGKLLLITTMLALCFWAKLTTVLAYVPFLVLLLPRDLGWKRLGLVSGLVVTAGAALFVSSYAVFGKLLSLDISYSFRFLVDSFSRRGHYANPLANLAIMGAHVGRWTGLLPWFGQGLLWAFALVAAWRSPATRARPLAIVLSLSGLVSLYYCARALTFGNAPFKYVFVSFGVVAAALAALPLIRWSEFWRPEAVGESQSSRSPLASHTIAALCAALGLALGALLVGDAVIQYGWSKRLGPILLLPLGLALLGVVMRAWRGASRAAAAQGLLRAAICLHLGLQLGIAWVQTQVAYSTTYDYGQAGLAETAAFLHARTGSGELITSMKDVGFLAQRRYIENYGAMYSDEMAGSLIQAWESGNVRYIVFTEGIGADQLANRPVLRDWIAQHAMLVASFGHYRIFEPRLAAAGTNETMAQGADLTPYPSP